jgi:hypothetical protein
MKIRSIMHLALAGVFALALVNTAQSQISYDGTGLNYTADFDSLGTNTMAWADNSTLSGWYLKASSSTFQNGGVPTSLAAVSVGGQSTAQAYNIGTNGVQPITTRALGWVVSSATGTAYIGLQLQNNSGNAFTGNVTLNYTIGQFSAKNTLSETVTTGYKLLVSSGNQLGSPGFSTLETIPNPNLSNSGGGIDGFAPGNFTTEQDTINFSTNPWNAGEYLWFQVAIPRESSGNNELLAIEAMSVTIPAQVVPEPASWGLFGTGLAAWALVRRRKLNHDE